MSAIKEKDTKPEMIVRKLVYQLGFRYRLRRKDLPGKPDLVFGPKMKVIFVHGCFWHQHCKEGCINSHMPKSNQSYWEQKLDSNVRRDKINCQKLKKLGWQVEVIWECETKDLNKLEKRINRFLN